MKLNNARKLCEEFKKITKIDLTKFNDNPFSFVFGGHFVLDIIRLDKFLQTPDGVSMQDFITEKYGKRAAKIIETLLKH